MGFRPDEDVGGGVSSHPWRGALPQGAVAFTAAAMGKTMPLPHPKASSSAPRRSAPPGFPRDSLPLGEREGGRYWREGISVMWLCNLKRQLAEVGEGGGGR